MDGKICTKCKQWKTVDNFDKNKTMKNGLNTWCKQCKTQYYIEHRQERLDYRMKHRDKYLETSRIYNEEHKEEIRVKRQKHYTENRDKILNNLRQKSISDPIYKFQNAISKSICKALKGNKNSIHWEKFLPYNLQQLKEHLESQFTPEMNWDNYGSYWEVDHIIPRNQFNITDYKCRDFQICWSLANLRPLNLVSNRKRPKDGRDISEEKRKEILNQKLGDIDV